MNFDLPEDAEEMRRATRDAVDAMLKHEPAYHETGVVHDDVEATLREMGFYGMAIPEAYGGNPLDHLTSVAIQLELARLPPQFWPFVRSSIGPGVHILVEHGSEALKSQWLPGIAAGLSRNCIAITEPSAGSDVARMSTTAVLDGDHYVLNGTKTFISNANHAHTITVLAVTDRKAGKKGLSAFLLDTRLPGFTITRRMKTMGWMDDSLCEIAFDNCRIPKDHLLGEEGRGLSYAMSGMNEGRLNVGCQALGPAQIALEQTIEHAKTRVTFGQALAEHQAIQHMIANMAMDLHAARIVLFEAVWRASRGEEARMKASMVKVICTEAACRIADTALQIFGGSGYCRGTVVERVYRDLRVLRIYEGASEIHRNMIARELLS
ncbi:acyl-CoA dehydrogenase family protein [Hydrogenophaga sp.]|uniref:acyl-CoA dehydrogenase family protein n=1 Tax=Hydrogenophaga sp. TaxID=1904254 RepID=UPI002719FF16|nr:acyl-CoA dehydrogenase family protein [Hydrogenophaga sp.]MDO9439074.1 acyl-CoA dehydrogenase family protein [Hydrogenophaga sp.]